MDFRLSSLLIIGLVTIVPKLNAQIEIGGEEAVEPVEGQKDDATEIYLVSNWSRTSSLLTESEELSAEPLGDREFESFLNTWSFGLGYRTRVNKYLSIQGGISYLRNGESFKYETPDSLFTYNTTYSYIAMPVKALFTYGNEIKVFAGGGLTPQLFSGYRQDLEWKTEKNATGSETIKRKNGYSSFVLSASVNIGVQLKFSKRWALLFMPEYRIQLTDSYEQLDAYDHFGRALGFDLGLTMYL
ncbi:MAG: outer membrane beta-barrel protein [Crocinitomicaceae bacterium]|nr:outer membrane beta-barrel protein [Crocinitomicaceae bacterium]MDG1659378.1 outer membrane beta-barrel protein [Crocinitomicaceae bacterium]